MNEDLARLLAEYSNDAQYVLDRDTRLFLAVNKGFERITGYTTEEALSPGFTADVLIHPQDLDTVKAFDDPIKAVQNAIYPMRLITKRGDPLWIEVSVHNLELSGRRLRVGSFRDIDRRKRLEMELAEEIQLRRRMALEMAKANVRIFQLTERLGGLPRFFERLEFLGSEDDVLRETVAALCERKGMAALGARVHLLRDERLVVAASSAPEEQGRVLPDDDPRAAFVRGSLDMLGLGESCTCFRLRGRERTLGLLEVELVPPRKILFDDKGTVREAQVHILSALGRTLGLMVENLRLYSDLARQSITDALTGVNNRRYFDTRLDEEVRRARRYGRDLAVVILDLDSFKEINDTLGHPQGDQVLTEVAEVLRTNTRELDTVCRVGGDEFVLLLPETAGPQARAKAESLRAAMETRAFKNLSDSTAPLKLSVSLGVAHLDPADRGAGDRVAVDLFRRADQALYTAKRGGRNRVSS